MLASHISANRASCFLIDARGIAVVVEDPSAVVVPKADETAPATLENTLNFSQQVQSSAGDIAAIRDSFIEQRLAEQRREQRERELLELQIKELRQQGFTMEQALAQIASKKTNDAHCSSSSSSAFASSADDKKSAPIPLRQVSNILGGFLLHFSFRSSFFVRLCLQRMEKARVRQWVNAG